jgi:ribosomal protein S27AE
MEKTAFENPTCMCCGNGLVLMQEDEDSGKRLYKCSHCGAIYLFYPCDKEEQESYGYYNVEIGNELIEKTDGFGLYCPQCGTNTVWQDSFMRSDIQDGVADDDSIVSIVSCPYCGASVEIIEPKLTEYKDYLAFQEKEDEEENYD